MINIIITIEDTENPDAQIGGTSEEHFENLEELTFWLTDVFVSDLYFVRNIEKQIKKDFL